MTTAEKVIKTKVELLKLAKQLGSVAEACRMMAYSRDSFYRVKELYGSATSPTRVLSVGSGLSYYKF
jgi:hypothetical protein